MTMTALNKIEEAEFFLRKMRESYRKEFIYYLSAFLSSTKSIPDYLLEEYNNKYKLNIPINRILNAHIFEKRARYGDHKEALRYIKFWKQRMKKLKSDAIGSFLFSKRNIAIHRIQPKPDITEVKMQLRVHEPSKVEVVFEPEGRVRVYETQKGKTPKIEVGSQQVDWFFKEYKKEPIITLCEKLLDNLKNFVYEAKKNF